jgi:anti-sigma regulatory factor (Ser/Thr protein kinase)/anti-anti-sigma regulatory factor
MKRVQVGSDVTLGPEVVGVSTQLRVHRADRDDGVVVLSASGPLDLRGASRLHRAIAKAIVDQPPAILIGLHNVEVRDLALLNVFAAAVREADEGGVRLGVVSSDQRVLGRLWSLRLLQQMAMGATTDEAAARLGTPPVNVRSRLRLSVGIAAPAAARDWLRTTADAWNLPVGLAEDAVLVLFELVTNAVEHVGTGQIVLQLAYREQTLRITVRDEGPMIGLQARRPRPDAAHGRGLVLVNALSRRWGVSRLGVGQGKAVWAVLPGHASAVS